MRVEAKTECNKPYHEIEGAIGVSRQHGGSDRLGLTMMPTAVLSKRPFNGVLKGAPTRAPLCLDTELTDDSSLRPCASHAT